MRLTYYGHSSFLVEARDGTRVILDPYIPGCFNGAVRYEAIGDPADVVIASHTHDDHYGVTTIPGNPLVLVQPKAETVGAVEIKGVEVFHDDAGGSERGTNTLIILDDGDLRLAHLGDLGHVLEPSVVKEVGRVDILLIPVGGFFTIDYKEAAKVVDELEPRIVVPMHYKTEKIDFPIAEVDPFLRSQPRVEHKDSSVFEVTAETLPARRSVIVLTPSR